jgi:hypothetical protein
MKSEDIFLSDVLKLSLGRARALFPQSRIIPHLISSASMMNLDYTAIVQTLRSCQFFLNATPTNSIKRTITSMSSLSSGEAESSSFQPFSKAERIQQLNDIDKVSSIQRNCYNKVFNGL